MDGMERNRMREFEELVLLGVMAAGDDAYGVSIQRILEEELGTAPSLGAVYTALDRCAQKGWVRSEMGDPTPVRGGRRRRHYRLTRAGLARVTEARNLREAFWSRVGPEARAGGVG
jgi:DNA-binding PadR family transcriptional regulator